VGPNDQRKTYKLVTFTEDDQGNPKNWKKARKWYITMVVGVMCFAVAFGSAVVTPGIQGVAEALHTSTEKSLLQITMFVIGFGIGRKSKFDIQRCCMVVDLFQQRW
jgi:hypothetical protein